MKGGSFTDGVVLFVFFLFCLARCDSTQEERDDYGLRLQVTRTWCGKMPCDAPIPAPKEKTK